MRLNKNRNILMKIICIQSTSWNIFHAKKIEPF